MEILYKLKYNLFNGIARLLHLISSNWDHFFHLSSKICSAAVGSGSHQSKQVQQHNHGPKLAESTKANAFNYSLQLLKRPGSCLTQ